VTSAINVYVVPLTSDTASALKCQNSNFPVTLHVLGGWRRGPGYE
jgi:hypothetical protein